MARLTLIGYWADDRAPGWPDPHDFVDETWDPQERSLCATYLRSGRVPWTQAEYSRCRFCGQKNGASEYTDGTYVWPEGLSHYIAEHAVKLPQVVIDHILHECAEYEFDTVEVDRDWWKQFAK